VGSLKGYGWWHALSIEDEDEDEND
jgi:hypothetical protein